jgi:selenide,water dikinase
LPKIKNNRVLIGYNSVDDAGVYKLTENLALVQTVDFFPPVVDDPYDYGSIAAANSLSDIYAMGGKPISALNIVGYPKESMPLSALEEVLRGGADKAKEAGIAIIGGHTLKTKEPIYGLSVNGIIHPKKIVSNAGAKPGDILILTKPLGIGIITTAIKRDRVPLKVVKEAVEVMSVLNKTASEVMVEFGVKACTDITGYGFLGHLCEMTSASGVGAKIFLSNIPVLDYAWKLAEQRIIPGGTMSNRNFMEGKVDWGKDICEEAKLILCDAQTSGGLLISVSKSKAQKLLGSLEKRGVKNSSIVGEIIKDKKCRIRVEW